MKVKELRALNQNDLSAKLKDVKEEYFNLRFQHGVGQLENTSMLSKVKKNIARLETVLREQQLSKG